MYKIYKKQIKINQFLKGGSKLKSIETNTYINNNFFPLINLIDDIDFNLVKPFFGVPIVFDNFDFKMLNAIIKTLNMFKYYKNVINLLKSEELFIKNLKKEIYNERDNNSKNELQNNLEKIIEEKKKNFDNIEKKGNIFEKNLLRFEKNIKESKKKLLQITIGNFKELGLFDHYENKFINFHTFVDNIISKENLSKITYDQKNPVSIFLILLLFKKNISFTTSKDEEGGKEFNTSQKSKEEKNKDDDQEESNVLQEINRINKREKSKKQDILGENVKKKVKEIEKKEEINPTTIDVGKGKIPFNDGISIPTESDKEIDVNKIIYDAEELKKKNESYNSIDKKKTNDTSYQLNRHPEYNWRKPWNYYVNPNGSKPVPEQFNDYINFKKIYPQTNLVYGPKIFGGYKPIIEDDYNNDLLEYYKKDIFYTLEEYYEDFKIIYDEYKDDIDFNKIYFRQTFNNPQYFSVNKRFLSMQGGNYDQLQYNLDGGSLNTIVRIPNLSSYFKSQLKFIENKLRANNKTLSENSRRDINQIIDSLDKHENNLKNNFELLKSAYLINEGTVNLKQHKSQIIEAKKSLSKHKRYAGTFGDLINTLEKIANNYKNKGKKPLDKFFQK